MGVASLTHPTKHTVGEAARTLGSDMRLTALIVACALFMQNLDSTVIATALPTMAKAFGADPLHMNVALTAYLLSLTVFIPASGWVADRYGTRNVFRAAIAIFTLGSVFCGQADTLGSLVLARIFQGLGGAMMVPVGRLVLLRSVAKSELVAAMAWLTMPALVGPVIGPPLGGLIITYASWRWIFDINVPIGVLGIILVSRYVKEVQEPRPDRFDSVGLVLSGVCLSASVAGLELSGRHIIAGWLTAALFCAGVLAGWLYLRHARRHPHPLLDLSLLRLPSFGVSVLAGTLFRIGIGAIPFLLPLMLQIGFGDSAAQSGMITFASSAGAIVMKPATQATLRWLGFRDTLVGNGVLSAALLALMAAFRPGWPLVAIYAVLLIGGFFRSLQFTAFNTLAYAEIPRERMSAATSLYSTAQQLSMALGISAGAAALHLATGFSHHTAPDLADFSAAFLAVAFVSLLSAPASLLMPRNAGHELTEKHLAPAMRGS